MGEERTLKPGPVAETLAACAEFLAMARELGVERLPAYGTSAVRKAKNPGALTGPLKALGIETSILGEDDEGRLNLLGALVSRPGQRAGTSLRATDWRQRNPHAAAGSPVGPAISGGPVKPVATPGVGPLGAPFGKPPPAVPGMLVLDPGGDSSECCGGSDWRTAPVASLPFGSVSLQERFGTRRDNDPIPWERLLETVAFAKAAALGHPRFAGFAGMRPAIRMNLPIQRALEQVNGLPPAEHGAGGPYAYRHLEALTRAVAATDHAGRARLMRGEPLGKVDRSCYGFASWLGILQALGAEAFLVEPWGIKLGAALHLNGLAD